VNRYFTKRALREDLVSGKAPLLWSASGYVAALLALGALVASLSLVDFDRRPAVDWKSILEQAAIARESGDLTDARSLYARAARVAFWYKEWEGLLASACGLSKLDGGKKNRSYVDDMLVQAMIAAEGAQSRVGIENVARAFIALGQEQAAAMAISSLKSHWPQKVARPPEPISDCG